MRMREVRHQTVGACVRVSGQDNLFKERTEQGRTLIERTMAGVAAHLDLTAVDGGTYELGEMPFQCFVDIGIGLCPKVSMGEGARP